MSIIIKEIVLKTYHLPKCPYSHNSNQIYSTIISTQWIICLHLRVRPLLLNISWIPIGKVISPQRHLIGQPMSRLNSREINSVHRVTTRISIPTNIACKIGLNQSTSSSRKIKCLILNKTPLKLVAVAIFKTNSTLIGISSKIHNTKISNLWLKLKIFKLIIWMRRTWVLPWIQRWISLASLMKGLTYRTIIIRRLRVTRFPTRCKAWAVTCHFLLNSQCLVPLRM